MNADFFGILSAKICVHLRFTHGGRCPCTPSPFAAALEFGLRVFAELRCSGVDAVQNLTGAASARVACGWDDAAAQSEIISYLIFGTPSFGVDGLSSATDRTVNAALVPYFGGLLEGVLGSVLPFFSSLQVATISGSGLKTLTTNPVDGLLNSFALTAGRQIGSDSFLNLSGGVCRGSRLTSTQSPSGWFGVSAEYKPRRGPSGVISVEPSGSPCSGLSRYQFGLDVFRDWKF